MFFLLTLIEKFEETYYTIPESFPHKILQHLREENDLKQEDLVKIIGSSEMILDVINGERSISEAQAKALAKFFKVDKKLFI